MLLRRKATWSFLLLWKSLLSSAVCVCVCVWNFSKEVKLVPMSPALYLFIYLFISTVQKYLFIYLCICRIMDLWNLICLAFVSYA